MKARVTVTLKSGILDPQGKAIEGALRSLGVGGVASVRQGKVFDIEIEGADRAGAEAALKDAAEKLLANTVIENYRVRFWASPGCSMVSVPAGWCEIGRGHMKALIVATALCALTFTPVHCSPRPAELIAPRQ